MSKLVVFGGNGFLGKRICQAGIESGLKVTSLSRSGKPPKLASHKDLHWIKEVNWKAADIFKPETYRSELQDANSVVHSIGILLENQNYKKTVNSNNSILSEFTNFLKPSNPLTKTSFNTYESINRDSALILAEAFQAENSSNESEKDLSFVYISADKGFPGLPKGYINSKREAEDELPKVFHSIRPILVRPGFLFDEIFNQDTVRSSIKAFVDTLDWGNSKIIGKKIGLLNDLVRPTVSTQRVSNAIIYRIKDKTFSGVVSLEDLLEK